MATNNEQQRREVLEEMTHDALLDRILSLEDSLVISATKSEFLETCLKSAENEVHYVENELASRLARHHEDMSAVMTALRAAVTTTPSTSAASPVLRLLEELASQRWQGIQDAHNWLYIQPEPKMRDDWRIPF